MNPAGMFNRSVTVRNGMWGDDTAGGVSVGTNEDIDSVPCSIQEGGSSEGGDGGRDSSEVTAVGYFPFMVGVAAVRLKVDTHVIDGDKTYRVRGAAEDVGGRGIYQRVNLTLEG